MIRGNTYNVVRVVWMRGAPEADDAVDVRVAKRRALEGGDAAQPSPHSVLTESHLVLRIVADKSLAVEESDIHLSTRYTRTGTVGWPERRIAQAGTRRGGMSSCVAGRTVGQPLPLRPADRSQASRL
jgi:hypothetical protein